MTHEGQNGPVAMPVAQSPTSKPPTTPTADLPERDNKESPVVKEEETNDTEVFAEVVVEVARLPKESGNPNVLLPRIFVALGVFCACFPPREAIYVILFSLRFSR